jgi:uncharacterized protein (DUF924 family)
MDEALRVREFWFGPLVKPQPGTKAARPAARSAELHRRMDLWFGSDSNAQMRAQQDALIAAEFSKLTARAMSGALASWADSPRRRLSLIILLDQFPRQIFRGQARAFAGDEQALGLTLSGMQSAADGALDTLERMFFYMPLQHSESLEVQDESVAAYRRLLSEAPADLSEVCQSSLASAEDHREIIRRFGRFPSRNLALGRASTPEERGYLQSGGATFGQ